MIVLVTLVTIELAGHEGTSTLQEVIVWYTVVVSAVETCGGSPYCLASIAVFAHAASGKAAKAQNRVPATIATNVWMTL